MLSRYRRKKLRAVASLAIELLKVRMVRTRNVLEFLPAPSRGPQEPEITPFLMRGADRIPRALLGTSECLTRSLVLARALARAGYPARIVLSVPRSRHSLEWTAHAHVELLPTWPSSHQERVEVRLVE